MNLISPIVNRWIQDGRENPEAFWERAANELHWFNTWNNASMETCYIHFNL